MRSVDFKDPRYLRELHLLRHHPRRSMAGNASKADALADRATRQAEEQDIYGLARPVLTERVADEDRTLTGGYLNEEIIDALRTGRARNSDVAEAARAFNTPWLLDEASMPRE